jgi:hypothetical protein
MADVVSNTTSMLRALSQLTTSCSVLLASGNFGLVRIPTLLFFIAKILPWYDEETGEKHAILSGGFF